MTGRSLLSRQRLGWFLASFLGGVFLVGFGYFKHLFDGERCWLAIGGVAVCWLVISAATWIAAKDVDRAEEFFNKNPWKCCAAAGARSADPGHPSPPPQRPQSVCPSALQADTYYVSIY